MQLCTRFAWVKIKIWAKRQPTHQSLWMTIRRSFVLSVQCFFVQTTNRHATQAYIQTIQYMLVRRAVRDGFVRAWRRDHECHPYSCVCVCSFLVCLLVSGGCGSGGVGGIMELRTQAQNKEWSEWKGVEALDLKNKEKVQCHIKSAFITFKYKDYFRFPLLRLEFTQSHRSLNIP